VKVETEEEKKHNKKEKVKKEVMNKEVERENSQNFMEVKRRA